MNLINNTDWDGRDLRQLCRRVIKHTDGRFGRTVEIYTSRSRGKDRMWEIAKRTGDTVGTVRRMYHGKGRYPPGRKIWMAVPMPIREVDGETLRHEFDEHLFARIMEHEVAHNRGLKHGEMTDELRYCNQSIEYVDDIDVCPKPSIQ